MDRINASSFPINQALRAYAQSPRMSRPGGAPYARSVQPMRPVAPTSPTTSVQPTQPIQQPQRADTIGKIAPKQSALKSSSIGDLVGGKVQTIDLTNDVAQITGPKPVMTSAGTYNMYPQAADRNLAATNVAVNRVGSQIGNVALGRSLDLRG